MNHYRVSLLQMRGDYTVRERGDSPFAVLTGDTPLAAAMNAAPVLGLGVATVSRPLHDDQYQLFAGETYLGLVEVEEELVPR